MKRKRDDNQLVLSFFDFDDEKENNWEEHWDGMPDWDHDKKDTPTRLLFVAKIKQTGYLWVIYYQYHYAIYQERQYQHGIPKKIKGI